MTGMKGLSGAGRGQLRRKRAGASRVPLPAGRAGRQIVCVGE